MKFNTKQIFQGDSKKEVVYKINYNFDQILSFGVGPDGHQGPMGATGIFGPAGKKGSTGASGSRANKWDSGNSQPSGSIQYDLWVKDDGDLDNYSATGSWNFTGFNFYNSLYFKLYNWIQGPAGVTDKYVIGFKDTLSASSYSFVVSDNTLALADSNPNKSKLIVSTEDQIETPILSFGKSGSSASGFPSFYWGSLGSSNNLILDSGGNINIVSYLSLRVTTASNNRILLDSYTSVISSQSRSYFTGNGDLTFRTNTTVGSGSSLLITSSGFNLTSSQLTSTYPLYIRTYNFGSTGGYALNSYPISPLNDGGIRLEVNGSSADRIFQFDDLSGSSVLSARPTSTSNSAGDFGQTIFGATGSSAGATAGPYAYHVSKATLLRYSTTSRSARVAQSNCSGATSLISNIFQVSSTDFSSNVIVITPTSLTSLSSNGIYVEIPSSYLSNLSGVYSSSHVNTYRILLDDILNSNPSTLFLSGIVFEFYSTSSSTCWQYVNFSTSPGQNCRFIDITYLPPANLYNSNPRIFYKTCNGTSGYVNMGSVYKITSPPAQEIR
jgi:hypothetical protein